MKREGVKEKGQSKANKKVMPTIKPGPRETGTGFVEMVSKELSLTQVVPEEGIVIDTDLKDTKVTNRGTKDSAHRSAPPDMAFPITPPYPAGGGDWACGVDFKRKEYTTTWSGAWQLPSLLGFPNIQHLTVLQAPQSNEKRRCWQRSTILDYGSYGYVRVLDQSSRYPILKIAHHGDVERRFISREFKMLKYLNTQPVVRVQDEPVVDKDGLFGFYMQKLCKVKIVELAKRLDELRDAIVKVHNAGIVINDVSISNVMLDAQDKITLIDFGFGIGKRRSEDTTCCLQGKSYVSPLLLFLHSWPFSPFPNVQARFRCAFSTPRASSLGIRARLLIHPFPPPHRERPRRYRNALG